MLEQHDVFGLWGRAVQLLIDPVTMADRPSQDLREPALRRWDSLPGRIPGHRAV
jgi:hypothetical protein